MKSLKSILNNEATEMFLIAESSPAGWRQTLQALLRYGKSFNTQLFKGLPVLPVATFVSTVLIQEINVANVLTKFLSLVVYTSWALSDLHRVKDFTDGVSPSQIDSQHFMKSFEQKFYEEHRLRWFVDAFELLLLGINIWVTSLHSGETLQATVLDRFLLVISIYLLVWFLFRIIGNIIAFGSIEYLPAIMVHRFVKQKNTSRGELTP